MCKGGSGNPRSKFQTTRNPKSNFQTDQNPKSKFQRVKSKIQFQYPKSRFQRPENLKSKFQRVPKSQIRISNDKNPKSEIAFHPPISGHLLVTGAGPSRLSASHSHFVSFDPVSTVYRHRTKRSLHSCIILQIQYSNTNSMLELCNFHNHHETELRKIKEQKYTNPARGILDFCKQKLWPLPCSQ